MTESVCFATPMHLTPDWGAAYSSVRPRFYRNPRSFAGKTIIRHDVISRDRLGP